MLPEKELREALKRIKLDTESAHVHRCVSLDYLDSLASSKGSRIRDNRYSRAGILSGLYVAYQGATAVAEVEQYIAATSLLPHRKNLNHTIITIRLDGEGILDLTDQDVVEELGTNYQELTGDWRLVNRLGSEAPTQRLGRLCYENENIQAIRYRSRIVTDSANVLVFTKKLGYAIELIDLPDTVPPQNEL